MARKAAEVDRQASYALDMEETHARLIEELAKVCRDYCNVTWDEALNVAGVPSDSAWRQLGSIYYHPDIRKILGAIPPPSSLCPCSRGFKAGPGYPDCSPPPYGFERTQPSW